MKRKERKAIPAWGKFVNRKLNMPMITQADRLHLHAASASVFFLSSYASLAVAHVHEFLWDDWSVFSGYNNNAFMMFSPFFLCGLIMTATALPMFPTSRQFCNYSAQMCHSMASTAALLTMAATFMLSSQGGESGEGLLGKLLTDASLPSSVLSLSMKVVASSTYLAMLWFGLSGRPWDIAPIAREMKINGISPAINVAATVLGVVWYVQAAFCVAHGVLGGTYHLTDLGNYDPVSLGFAAQMSLALAVTPASDALVAGTFMKNESFNKGQGERIILYDGEGSDEMRPRKFIESLQLLFVYPGPVLVPMGLAYMNGHGDVVSNFFYWNELHSLWDMAMM
jgi:hypothetical protein